METVKVVIRQNQRWDNMLTIDKPSFAREGQQKLEYRFFDFSNNFLAGNEYRFADLRSLRYPGQGVYTTDLQAHPIEARLMTNEHRIFQAYAQLNDLNGNFVVQNNDTGGGNLSSDYLYVDFTLDTKEQLQGSVYVVGQMNNYDRSNANKMEFDSRSQLYKGKLLLKQGWYDYQYVVEADTLNYNYIEGNHFETENNYEILVYYTPMSFRSDILIGYRNVTINRRN